MRRTTDDRSLRQLGSFIRRRRQHLELSMQVVADRAGLSQPFLSQVERGDALPSMRSLDRIAQALGSSAISLLAGDSERSHVDLIRASDRFRLVQTELAPSSSATELTRGGHHLRAVEFGGGDSAYQERPFVHRNEELVLILDGSYVFDVAGTEYELGAGDAISYAGGVEHRYRIVGEPPHRFLAVIIHDDFEVVPRLGLDHDGPRGGGRSPSSDAPPVNAPMPTGSCGDTPVTTPPRDP